MVEYKYLLDYKRRELMERLNEKTDNKGESEAIELTGFEALEILDEMNHTDSYRWHILKDDPYDLPKGDGKVLCCTKNKKKRILKLRPRIPHWRKMDVRSEQECDCLEAFRTVRERKGQ